MVARMDSTSVLSARKNKSAVHFCLFGDKRFQLFGRVWLFTIIIWNSKLFYTHLLSEAYGRGNRQ